MTTGSGPQPGGRGQLGQRYGTRGGVRSGVRAIQAQSWADRGNSEPAMSPRLETSASLALRHRAQPRAEEAATMSAGTVTLAKGHPLPWSSLVSSLIFPRDSQCLVPLPTLKAPGNGLQTGVAFYAWRWSFFPYTLLYVSPTKPLWGSYYYPHLPDKETEVEAGQLTCMRSPASKWQCQVSCRAKWASHRPHPQRPSEALLGLWTSKVALFPIPSPFLLSLPSPSSLPLSRLFLSQAMSEINLLNYPK